MMTPFIRTCALFLFLLSVACNTVPDNNTTTDNNVSDSSLTIPVSAPVLEEKPESPFKEGAFEIVDAAAFNQILAKESKKLSPKEVIKLYYPAVIQTDDHSFQNIKVEEKKEGDKTIVTLTHDNQPHITIQGHRMMMTMIQEGKQWYVKEIKQQFKCWKRSKGDVIWSTNKCPNK